MKQAWRNIRLAAIIIAVSFAVSSKACEIDRLLENRFLWPGSEEAKFLLENHRTDPGIALFDSVHSFDALHYRLDLNFPMEDNYFDGSMALRLAVVDDSISSIGLHMVHLVADSAFAEGELTTYDRADSTITVNLSGYRHFGDTLTVEIFYHDYTTNRGYYYYERDAYTMAEPQDARWWYPCFDEPWDKATSETFATVPENYDVGSNGYLESVEHDQQNHTRRYHWVNDYPTTTYLVSLVMADYAIWTDYYVISDLDSIPVLNMVYAEDSTDADYDFENVPDMIGVFSELFYPYPYNKYGQAAVFPYPYGAMEHLTMTTMHQNWITGDRAIEGGYSHELGHMWWGDFVTMSDWRHIWLNEGFATYSTAVYEQVAYGPRIDTTMEAYRMSYIADAEYWGHYPLYDPPYLFSTPVYVKGAWVLHMLRGILDDYAFFGGLHYYASLYGHGNASTWDFIDAMETVSGRELDWFFDEWIFDQAHPIYNYAWSYAGDGPYTVHLEIQQVQTEAPPFRMPIPIEIVTAGENFEFTVENRLEYQNYDFTIPAQPLDLLFDPDNWVLKESDAVTAIDGGDLPIIPTRAYLGDLYPNPFNGSINIAFAVEGLSQPLTLSLFDISGRFVKEITSGDFSAGHHIIRFDMTGNQENRISSGVYFVKLSSPSGHDTRRITFIK
ncbi:MAG: M1 family aminopeptidase [candidate division Zixibacteria bacterium]